MDPKNQRQRRHLKNLFVNATAAGVAGRHYAMVRELLRLFALHWPCVSGGRFSSINISNKLQVRAQVAINAAKGPARRRLLTLMWVIHELSVTISGDRYTDFHPGHARIGANDNTESYQGMENPVEKPVDG